MGTEVRHSRVSVDGVTELHYVEAGAGDPILFVPGWTMGWEVFIRQLNSLSATHRVISLDPRSQGDSSRSVERNTYSQQGKDVASFISALGLKNVVLVGWSYGGLAAYAYTEAAGTQGLKALIIVDMTPKPLGSLDTGRMGTNTCSWTCGPCLSFATVSSSRAHSPSRWCPAPWPRMILSGSPICN